MRLLLTGAGGQLGTDIQKAAAGAELLPLTHDELDITDNAAVSKACRDFSPDVIVNTAAYVRVDDCETNRDGAYAVNALGAGNVAAAARETGAKLVHISTDYVFGGGETGLERQLTEEDVPVPVNVYGASKLAGEEKVRQSWHRHFIVRSSGLFGVAGSSGKGGNFVETILRLAVKCGALTVVKDQRLSPTYTHDLAAKILELVATDGYGIYHVTNSGTCSWYEFAGEILRLAGLKVKISPVTSEQYPRPAGRPRYSVLDNACLRLLGRDNMRPWQDALAAYMAEREQGNDEG
ncbi:dTDP-4-dehydrorhamnose reductase [Chloroflexota bacterium]